MVRDRWAGHISVVPLACSLRTNIGLHGQYPPLCFRKMLRWVAVLAHWELAICSSRRRQYPQEAAIGGAGGNAFDDFNNHGLAGGISEICTRSESDQLGTIAVNYAGYKREHGEPGGRRRSRRRWIKWGRRRRIPGDRCWSLRPDEHVTSATVTVNGGGVQWISFATNNGRNSGNQLHGGRRRQYNCGGRRRRRRRDRCSRRREWAVTMNAPQDLHLFAFHGRAGDSIDKIGVYWGKGGGLGRWSYAPHCSGCDSNHYEIKQCSTTSQSMSQESKQSWSVAVKSELTLGFKLLGVGASKTTTVDGKYSRELISKTSESFKFEQCKTHTFSCSKNYMFQWNFESNLNGQGVITTNTGFKLCTNDPSPCCLPGAYVDPEQPSTCDADPSAPNHCDRRLDVII